MGKKRNSDKKKLSNWVMMTILLTFLLATGFSFFTEAVVRNLNLAIAFIILVIIIIVGIIFDIIGIAVTASDVKPLNAMAAQKIPGAREAVTLHKNADLVSNICNDVIGDICGIISGAAGAVIVTRFVLTYPFLQAMTLGIMVSSLIAAVTVGGKAFGKTYAINNATQIAYKVGLMLNIIYRKTGVGMFSCYKKKRRKW